MPLPAGGGYRNIIRFCRFLAEFGHEVTLHADPLPHTPTAGLLKQAMEKWYGPIPFRVELGFGSVAPTDVLVATFWPTAYFLRDYPHAKKKIYFVQDFEPDFYPKGSSPYIQAEETYRMGFYHITYGQYCTDLLRKRYGQRADCFPVPIDRSIYKPGQEGRVLHDPPHVIFFSRPSMPRRCFPLGVKALTQVHAAMPHVRITLFGEVVDSSQIPFPHTNLGVLPTVEDVAKLYRGADLGLVFSTISPSMVSLEMMACGCPVVDLDREAQHLMYQSSANACLVPAEPEAIAAAVCRLLNDSEALSRLRRNGLALAAQHPDDEGVARIIEMHILREMERE